MSRSYKIKAEERFSVSEKGYTIGKLLDGTECHILLGTGQPSPQYTISNVSHYTHLTKFASKIKNVQVC